MRRVLTAAALGVSLLACDSTDDRLVGSWAFEGEEGREVTTFRKDGSLLHIQADGDSVPGFYTFINRNTVKLDVVDDGDSMAYLWELDFRGDTLRVGLTSEDTIDLTRLE